MRSLGLDSSINDFSNIPNAILTLQEIYQLQREIAAVAYSTRDWLSLHTIITYPLRGNTRNNVKHNTPLRHFRPDLGL